MFVSLAFRYLVEDRLNRRIGFQHRCMQRVAKLSVRLAHLFLRRLHRRVLHRFLARGLQLFAFVSGQIGEALFVLARPAVSWFVRILAKNDPRNL